MTQTYKQKLTRLNAIHREVKLTLGDAAEPQVINRARRQDLIELCSEYSTLVSEIVLMAQQPAEGGET